MTIRVEWRAGEVGIEWSVRTFLWALLFAVAGGPLAIEAPEPPRFLTAPGVLTDQQAIHVELWVEPFAGLRSVGLEAWAQDGLSRRSAQTVSDRKLYAFDWRPLAEGAYVLTAFVTWAGGYGLRRERSQTLIVTGYGG